MVQASGRLFEFEPHVVRWGAGFFGRARLEGGSATSSVCGASGARVELGGHESSCRVQIGDPKLTHYQFGLSYLFSLTHEGVPLRPDSSRLATVTEVGSLLEQILPPVLEPSPVPTSSQPGIDGAQAEILTPAIRPSRAGSAMTPVQRPRVR